MTPLTPDDIAWIAANRDEDISRLILRSRGDECLRRRAEQLECRRKARGKLDDWPVDERFIFPNSLAVEQSTSCVLAREHAALVSPGERVLDMTCGLGIDAMHLAKKAAVVTACDLKADNIEAAKLNAANAGLTNITLLCEDSIEHLKTIPCCSLDTIFVDPSRRDKNGGRLIALSHCSPDVTTFIDIAAEKAKRLIVKCSPMLDITHTLRELRPYTANIIIYGTPHECKELVAVVDLHSHEPRLSQITAKTPGYEPIEVAEGTAVVQPQYSLPKIGDTLLEPFPAVTKAAAHVAMAQKYGLSLISEATHLLHTSRSINEKLQASAWTVEELLPMSKNSIKDIKSRYTQLSVATRGFRMTADELRRRIGVKEGAGSQKLWGITTPEGSQWLLIAVR